MIRPTMLMAAAAVALGACGGSKAPAPDTSAGAASAAGASETALDSTKADTSMPSADSSAGATPPGAKAAASKKPDSTGAPGDYDRALKPKFTVDEKTGKLVPIKRP